MGFDYFYGFVGGETDQYPIDHRPHIAIVSLGPDGPLS
jgi:hypothetical protein